MSRGVLALLTSAALWALPLAAQDTGWRNPSQDYGDFRYPKGAYYDDADYALAEPGQTHVFFGYEFPIPGSAEILGIEVRLDVRRHPAGGPFVAYLEVQLSGDGGATWTPAKTAGPIESYWQTFLLGGPKDLWGRAWRPEELAPHRFLVRLTAWAPRWPTLYLDWVAVRVYYRTGLVLEVEPPTVALGTLTLADYDRGYRDLLEAQAVTLYSPVAWVLYIAAARETWSYTGPLPDPKKPCGHLLWRVEAAGGSASPVEQGFLPLSVSERAVAKGTAGWAKLALSFRLLVDYDTTWPGTYALDFRYTLVVP
ncbi:MAG: hypothetical protein NZ924_04105 [Candidatus Bipolaricaulota bacterium]|nr:hypothetical protein [Candidatus Bipolaricaulota bacterium]MDW8152085.1 hypothetical protein [Candidatus Bipolaricaulota bacterium]